MVGNCWIAPNATLVGEMNIGDYTSIWHNVVIRGDINYVKINGYSSIGDRTVIHTANSLPTGFPAANHIGTHVTVGAGCSIYSCVIEDEAYIGANTVIMEGCRIEKAAIVLPNSVVPPGRLIPAGQIWGGNPVKYVRDATESEIFANYANTFQIIELSQQYLNQFTPWSYNYLKKESTNEDVDLKATDLVDSYLPLAFRPDKIYNNYGIS
jgi:carbonic anhydrase/acetyltransferase-like protein (isoleucine patch superfamily)